MCFIIAMVMLVLSFNFYNAGTILLAVGSFLTSALFIYFMIKNILHVKKIRESRNNDN